MRKPSPAPDDEDKESLKKRFAEAMKEVRGKWSEFRSGEWLLQLVQQSFASYAKNANAEYFKKKYKNDDKAFLIKKLTEVASKNAALLGAITGAAISTDEIVMVATGAEGGIGLPANIAIGAGSIMAEMWLLAKMQLQLVANIASVHEVALDPKDPEDILIILGYAMGGACSEMVGKAGMKIGGKAAGKIAGKVFSKELLASIKRIFAKIGMKILQRTIIKYVVPGASILIGGGWNYTSTRAIGKLADKHFSEMA